MAQEKHDRIVCLFGSGISIPAGMPNTEEISKVLLSPRDFHRCPDGSVPFDAPASAGWFPPSKTERELHDGISKTIKLALDEIAKIPRTLPNHEPNYEDIIYLLHRLAQYPPAEPLLEVTVEKLRKCFLRNLEVNEDDLDSLLIRTINCMTDRLRELLCDTRIRCTDHLGFMQQMIAEHGSANVTIATTNHDRLLEQYLSLNGIDFLDGFARDGAEKDLWRPQILDAACDRLQLLKIHGSIDWYLIMPPKNWNHGREYVRMDRPGRFLHPDGKSWTLYESQPRMVVGTLDKQEHYLTGITGDLICRFRQALKDSRRLVVCGYGFQDSGVNKILFEWAFGELPRRMVVVDPRPDVVTRTEYRYWWQLLTSQGVSTVLPMKLGQEDGDLTWRDLKSLLAE